jgi:hypothetical protein
LVKIHLQDIAERCLRFLGRRGYNYFVYTQKNSLKRKQIRKESQEYPNKSLEDAFMDKISTTEDEEDDDGKA